MLEVVGEVHARHASTAEFTADPVAIAEHLRGFDVGRVLCQFAEPPHGRVREQWGFGLTLDEQLLEGEPARGVCASQGTKQFRPPLRWRVEQLVEERRQLFPVLGKERSVVARSARR